MGPRATKILKNLVNIIISLNRYSNHIRLSSSTKSLFYLPISLYPFVQGVECNPHAKRLYDDLLHDYNRLIRPVPNFTETLTVRLGLKLSQLIDVDLKNQVMTTNVWVDQVTLVSHLCHNVMECCCRSGTTINSSGIQMIMAE